MFQNTIKYPAITTTGKIDHKAGVLVISFLIFKIYSTIMIIETSIPSRQSLICSFLSINRKIVTAEIPNDAIVRSNVKNYWYLLMH
jgi:hypothetical protein